MEEFLLLGISFAHMLRMPLDTDAEGVEKYFQAFNKAILTDSRNCQTRTKLVYCLMVQAVDLDGVFTQDAAQFGIGGDLNSVDSFAFGWEMGVPAHLRSFNILIECAIIENVQQLDTPADAENRPVGGKKSLQHSHFRFVTELVGLAALFSGCLTVERGIEICAAGEQ